MSTTSLQSFKPAYRITYCERILTFPDARGSDASTLGTRPRVDVRQSERQHNANGTYHCSLLLGIVASVEATINRTVGKRARTRVQQNPAVVHNTADTNYFVTAFGQVSCASQIYGLGAPAA
ncbi:hypothetical protein WJX79_001970 [Trebouxia sp. C0005]